MSSGTAGFGAGWLLATAHRSALPGGIVGSLLHVHGPVAYALVGLLVFSETAFFVGFFIPGETAAVVGGVLAGTSVSASGRPEVNLVAMIAVVVVAAVAGDSVGYLLGRLAGPWLLTHRPLRGRPAVTRSRDFVDRYGGPAVFLGRFVAFARAVVPGLVGMSDVRYRVFLVYNAVGGLLWGIGYTLLGYAVGLSFEALLHRLSEGLLLAVIVVVVVGTAVVILRRARRRRAPPGGECD